jgi:hypothetical protein
MIESTSSSDRATHASALPLHYSKPAPTANGGQSDRISTSAAEHLQASLANQPEVRPEVVARGQALASDPDYPSAAIIQQVAGAIVNSPDLSEDRG